MRTRISRETGGMKPGGTGTVFPCQDGPPGLFRQQSPVSLPVLPDPEPDPVPDVSCQTSAGDSWVPTFIVSSDMDNCCCCTACYVVCGRDVFDFIVRPDQNAGCGPKAMMVARPGNCMGCGACERAWPRHNIICRPQTARDRKVPDRNGINSVSVHQEETR